MFVVKICGVTTVSDARWAAEAGADAIGLNFYPPSPRFLDLRRAEAIADALPGGVAKVGVFVNAPTDEVIHLHDRLGLDAIQLHGDEPPEILGALGQRRVIRAFRLRDGQPSAVLQYIAQCRQAQRTPEAVLIDAYDPGSYGGTGKMADWNVVREAKVHLGGIPVVLAGGLTPENVAEAIAWARPDAVDTASGVESEPGVKDAQRVQQFVARARAAFARRAAD